MTGLRRWERADGRVYAAEVGRDLFGTWILMTIRGSLFSRRRDVRSAPFKSEDEAKAALARTGRLRERHGYRALDSSSES